MLQRFVKYTFTVLSAAYFLVAGVGYNVVKYCCESCAEASSEVVERCSCGSQHNETDASCQTHHENSFEEASEACSFTRISVDIPSVEPILHIENQHITCVDLYFTCVNLLIENPNLINRPIFPPPRSCFPSSGRDILALNAVLLI